MQGAPLTYILKNSLLCVCRLFNCFGGFFNYFFSNLGSRIFDSLNCFGGFLRCLILD